MSHTYKHLSGAAKRKERDKKDKDVKRGQTQIDSYIKKPRLSSDPPNEQLDSSIIHAPACSSRTNVETTEQSETFVETAEQNETFVETTAQNENTVEDSLNDQGGDQTDSEQSIETEKSYDDLGHFDSIISESDITKLVLQGPSTFPSSEQIEKDLTGKTFPSSILSKKLANGEKVKRDYLCYSLKKKSVYCFACRLFGSKQSISCPSYLASPGGSSRELGYHRLYNVVPSHENSDSHRKNYLEWKSLEANLKAGTTIDSKLQIDMDNETKKWRTLLHRILDVIIFLAERALAFQGHSDKIGDVHNGNFLGILELLSNYDVPLKEHMVKVQQSQEAGKRLQCHYLSNKIQNEFIDLCGKRVREAILSELAGAKYYSIMVDATPDASCQEQSTFIFRYLILEDGVYTVKERFYTFIDDNGKTGAEIAHVILKVIDDNKIPIKDCRGQGFDNARNMSGQYNGVQAKLKEVNPLITYSPCGCHSLNLCGNDSAECCKETVTFFGMLQWFFNFFHHPMRWEILKDIIDDSLHGPSWTRWSLKLKAVVPFKKHIHKLAQCLEKCKGFKLTPKVRAELNGALNYIQSFESILMACIWLEILRPIDACNNAIQAQNCTLDVEVDNLEGLVKNLEEVNNKWQSIVDEAKEISALANVDPQLPDKRGSSALTDDQKIENFKTNVFDKVLHTVIEGMEKRFKDVKDIRDKFAFLWTYESISDVDLQSQCQAFSAQYPDVSERELSEELKSLKLIHKANFKTTLPPLMLLNQIAAKNYETLFPYVTICLRIFLTLPVTVATAERSFSKLKLIKNYLRSTIGQERLVNLAVLGIENDLTRKISFDDIIDSFAREKARKAPI